MLAISEMTIPSFFQISKKHNKLVNITVVIKSYLFIVNYLNG